MTGDTDATRGDPHPGPVCSHNEWDPLEEVIVGVLDGMHVEGFEMPFYGVCKPGERDDVREFHLRNGGRPREITNAARSEVEGLAHVLESEGIRVRRPDPIDHGRPIVTPDWAIPSGWGQPCPRDLLIVVGDEILEAPMSYRARFFEVRAYRRLITEYFRAGARWSAAPKSLMADELYTDVYRDDWSGPFQWAVTELEPVFDAADIARCGRDLFVQRSHLTNELGIAWLRQHFAGAYRVHRVEFHDRRASHIDATWLPVGPGRVLVNPDRPMKDPPEFLLRSGWEFLESPRTIMPAGEGTRWLLMNVLMLDRRRVIVEKHEEPMIRALRDWGFDPIPLPFRNACQYGGGFHCFTCDIRRRGPLESYLPALD